MHFLHLISGYFTLENKPLWMMCCAVLGVFAHYVPHATLNAVKLMYICLLNHRPADKITPINMNTRK